MAITNLIVFLCVVVHVASTSSTPLQQPNTHELRQQQSSVSRINQRQLLHTHLQNSPTSSRQLKADDKVTYRSTHAGQQHYSSKAAKGTKLYKSSKSKSGKSSDTKSGKVYHSKSAKGYTTDMLLSFDYGGSPNKSSKDSPSLNELILDEIMLDDTTTTDDDESDVEDSTSDGDDVESVVDENNEEEDAQGQNDGLSSLDDVWLTDDVTDEGSNAPSPTLNNGITPFPTTDESEPVPTPNLEPANFDIDGGTTSYAPTKGLDNDPPYTLEQRKSIIQQKCKSTIHSRSNSLLHIIGSFVSNPEQSLVSQEGPLYNAFVWLVHYDDAILCPPTVRLVEGGGVEIRTLEIMRIKQRYVMAALYYSLNGDGWSNCSADRHLFTDQDGDKEVGKCLNQDGIRFLDYRHECTWFGLTCDDTPKIFDWHEYIDVDTYHAITEIALSDNNLVGELPIEFYRELDTLQVLDMERNSISGTLSDDVGRLKELQVLKL